ncbi:hypothetical protein ACS0TY_014760 [Phlomoides rotata]
MEKGKRVEAEFQLPEAIIQHIQSFLNGKEAAQTTLLSKSWNDAWLTRPNLDFDQKAFERKSSDDTQSSQTRFWNFVNKTVERCWRSPSATWILNLNKLLTKLSLSKVSLSLQIYSGNRFDCAENIKGLPKPEVENLTINSYCSDLFDVLFRCCRPIYVTQEWFPNVRMRNNDFMEFIYKRVMQDVSLKCCGGSQIMSGECDLEEVDVEFFDEVVSAWRPRLLDASTRPGADKQIIRLHLRWGR